MTADGSEPCVRVTTLARTRAGDRHRGAPRVGARDCFSGAGGHGGGQIGLGCCYFPVFYSQARAPSALLPVAANARLGWGAGRLQRSVAAMDGGRSGSAPVVRLYFQVGTRASLLPLVANSSRASENCEIPKQTHGPRATGGGAGLLHGSQWAWRRADRARLLLFPCILFPGPRSGHIVARSGTLRRPIRIRRFVHPRPARSPGAPRGQACRGSYGLGSDASGGFAGCARGAWQGRDGT
jgi:hypothetical protein